MPPGLEHSYRAACVQTGGDGARLTAVHPHLPPSEQPALWGERSQAFVISTLRSFL